MVNVLYLNADGAGFAERITLQEGTTICAFLEGQEVSIDENMILVNRQNVSKDQVLQEGDRISVTPLKIEGA